jgi:hypothetical protein
MCCTTTQERFAILQRRLQAMALKDTLQRLQLVTDTMADARASLVAKCALRDLGLGRRA